MSGVTAKQLRSLPGSLLAECLELEVKDSRIVLPVDWINAKLLEAGVRAHTHGKVLVPVTITLAEIKKLVDYLRLPESVWPHALVRQSQTAGVVEERAKAATDYMLAAINKVPVGQNPLRVSLSLKDFSRGVCPEALKWEIARSLRAEGYARLQWTTAGSYDLALIPMEVA